MSDEETIIETIQAAKKPGKFSIVDVIKDRAYPEAKIPVMLDEAKAYEASLLQEKLVELQDKIKDKSMTKAQTDEVSDLTNKIEEISDEMRKASYFFHIKGISEGRRESIFAEARKKYPVEYERANDMSALLGNATERNEKQSPERDNLFTDFLWKEHIQKIEDPDGNEQLDFSYSDIKELRQSLPLGALANINSAIEKIRTSTAVFMMETGEDFLAKP